MCSDSSAGPAAKQPEIMVDPIWIATFEMGNRHCTGNGHVIDLHFPSICQPTPRFNLACSATEDNTQMWRAKKASLPVLYGINRENAINKKTTIAISGEA
jgi:hypothetical protein